MGYWKNRQLEEQDRGYGHTGAFACATCIGDPWLAAVIEESPADEPCSYCEGRPSADLDDVIERALECLSSEYRPESVETPPWDNEDKRYIVTPVDLGELIRVHLDDEPEPRLWQDVEDALHGEPWFERNAYAIRPHDQILSSWRRFEELVTTTQTEDLRPLSPSSNDPDDWIETSETLDRIGQALAELPSLYVTFPAGSTLWRARASSDPAGFGDPLELAPPKMGERKGPQRMSVDGENWFYGATTPDLAIAEKYRAEDPRHLSRGRFETVVPMTLVDLTDEAIELPSIYNLGVQSGRLAALFLHDFAQEIAKPVDDAERDSYRPTQLMTRYVRTELPRIVGMPIDGIVYPSARGRGHNVVLFHERSACIRKGDPATRRARLAIDRSSVGALDHEAAGRVAQAQLASPGGAGPGHWSAWETWAVQRLMLGLPAR